MFLCLHSIILNFIEQKKILFFLLNEKKISLDGKIFVTTIKWNLSAY
jgi:hypothetical protein